MSNIFEEFYGPSMESEMQDNVQLHAQVYGQEGIFTPIKLAFNMVKWVFSKIKGIFSKTVKEEQAQPSSKTKAEEISPAKAIQLYSKPYKNETTFDEYVKNRDKVLSILNKKYSKDLVDGISILSLVRYLSGSNLLDFKLTPEYTKDELWQEVLRKGLNEDKSSYLTIDKIKPFPNIKK